MNTPNASNSEVPTPDSLRISRLDRLLDQLGEHQLTIRQHGVSVTDLSQRLKTVESTLQSELGVLSTIKEVDIVGQLAALQSSIDKIQRQLATKSREDTQTNTEYQLKLQSLENKQNDMEISLQSLYDQVQAALNDHANQMNEFRQTTKSMLSQVVTRIADQFDAVQSSFEDVLASHTKDQEDLLSAIEVASSETKQWSEEKMKELSNEISTQKEQVLSLVSLKIGENTTALHKHKEKQQASEELLQQALSVWQQGIEGRLNDLLTKLGEYKQYTSKLRKDIHQLQDDSTAVNTALVEALAKELSGVGEGISLLQRDAAGLLAQSVG